jgi:hypothetical protein
MPFPEKWDSITKFVALGLNYRFDINSKLPHRSLERRVIAITGYLYGYSAAELI